MKINVNRGKLSGFILDSRNNLRVPKWFGVSELRPLTKEIFEGIAEYALANDTAEIPAEEFCKIVEGGKGWTTKKLYAIAELEGNRYIERVES